jgi:cathepsin S
MLLVGYGNLDGKDYWKLKNSQGINWGRDGFMLLIRNKADDLGPCGLQMDNFMPLSLVV